MTDNAPAVEVNAVPKPQAPAVLIPTLQKLDTKNWQVTLTEWPDRTVSAYTVVYCGEGNLSTTCMRAVASNLREWAQKFFPGKPSIEVEEFEDRIGDNILQSVTISVDIRALYPAFQTQDVNLLSAIADAAEI